MKKIAFLSAMLLVLVSAFATDTPAYAPRGFHPGYRPVYGHGFHLRPVRPVHKPFNLFAGHGIQGTFIKPMPAFKEAPSLIVSLAGFAAADADINEAAIMEMTRISLPQYAESDDAILETAVMEMTKISLPDFSQADASVNASAIMEMTRISLPVFIEADADMSSRWSLGISH